MHHAYLVEGSHTDFELLKRSVQPFVATWYERFGIEDARALVDESSLKREGESVYVIGASTVATEAQQALLKLFEEPREGLRFILVVPHGTLLPTLRSRMLEYPQTVSQTQERSGQIVWGHPRREGPRTFGRDVLAFIQGTQKVRSDMITALLKDEEGTKERVRELLDGLEQDLYVRLRKSNSQARSDLALQQALSDIAMVRDYVRDRSPSLKMLLEHLALSVPNK